GLHRRPPPVECERGCSPSTLGSAGRQTVAGTAYPGRRERAFPVADDRRSGHGRQTVAANVTIRLQEVAAGRPPIGAAIGPRQPLARGSAEHECATKERRMGDGAAAVPLYRELLHAEPTLESVARQLFRCHALLGDGTALVREERHLREALIHDFGYPGRPA